MKALTTLRLYHGLAATSRVIAAERAAAGARPRLLQAQNGLTIAAPGTLARLTLPPEPA
jgi:hypothetical protein